MVDGEPVETDCNRIQDRKSPDEQYWAEYFQQMRSTNAYGTKKPNATENTVMVHIRRIREKIEIDAKNPRYLKVVWGIGIQDRENGLQSIDHTCDDRYDPVRDIWTRYDQ